MFQRMKFPNEFWEKSNWQAKATQNRLLAMTKLTAAAISKMSRWWLFAFILTPKFKPALQLNVIKLI